MQDVHLVYAGVNEVSNSIYFVTLQGIAEIIEGLNRLNAKLSRQAMPNNGMHPTATQLGCLRQLRCCFVGCAAGAA
jgi:hypothetical protein